MYRPNRIGPWPLVSIDEGTEDVTLSPRSTSQVQYLTVAVADRVSITTDLQNTLYSNGQYFSACVPIDGNPANRTEFILSVSGAFILEPNLSSSLKPYGFFVSRAENGSVSLSTFYNIGNPYLLGFDDYASNNPDEFVIGNINKSVIVKMDDSDTKPLVFGCLFKAASNVRVLDGQITLSAHAYRTDIPIVDPNR